MVQALTAEPVVGEIYEGTVKSTTAFGAFVEIMPGTEALLHISELRWGRTDKTEDVVKRGDRVQGEADRPRRARPPAAVHEGAAAQAGGHDEPAEATARAGAGAGPGTGRGRPDAGGG